MINWGESLIKELAARRCIIFLGAGASLSCLSEDGTKHPPDWEKLLKELNSKLTKDCDDQNLATQLISEKKFLDAAEIIVASINKADYANSMRQLLELPRFKESNIHKAILNLDPKIVITTNFDTIYDRYCTSGKATEGYTIILHSDTHLVQQLRSPIRNIIKAHGCIQKTDDMVLTRSGYFEARRKHPHFFKVLDALFLTHTILFIGYSLSDPDIQIALENASISAPSSNPHYFVTEYGTHQALKSAASRTYNISFLEFKKGDYSDLEKSLNELVQQVLEYRSNNPDA